MLEPADKSFVLVGSLADSDPWDVYVYARDDESAKGSTANWFWIGAKDGSVERVSWDRLLSTAQDLRTTVTLFATADVERP